VCLTSHRSARQVHAIRLNVERAADFMRHRKPEIQDTGFPA